MKFGNSFWLLHNLKLLILKMPPSEARLPTQPLSVWFLWCLGFKHLLLCPFPRRSSHFLSSCKLPAPASSCSCSSCFDWGGFLQKQPSERPGFSTVLCSALLSLWLFLGTRIWVKLDSLCSLCLCLHSCSELTVSFSLPHFSSLFFSPLRPPVSYPSSSIHLSPFRFAPNRVYSNPLPSCW